MLDAEVGSQDKEPFLRPLQLFLDSKEEPQGQGQGRGNEEENPRKAAADVWVLSFTHPGMWCSHTPWLTHTQ